MSVCLFVRGLWGGCRAASQPFNHAFTSFGTITYQRIDWYNYRLSIASEIKEQEVG
jgi:hypothetical protein